MVVFVASWHTRECHQVWMEPIVELQGVKPSICYLVCLNKVVFVAKFGWMQLWSYKELNRMFVWQRLCLWPPDKHRSVTKLIQEQLWSFIECNLKVLDDMSASGSTFYCPLGMRACVFVIYSEWRTFRMTWFPHQS